MFMAGLGVHERHLLDVLIRGLHSRSRVDERARSAVSEITWAPLVMPQVRGGRKRADARDRSDDRCRAQYVEGGDALRRR